LALWGPPSPKFGELERRALKWKPPILNSLKGPNFKEKAQVFSPEPLKSLKIGKNAWENLGKNPNSKKWPNFWA